MKRNWIEIFENLNEDEPQKFGVRETPRTNEQKEKALSDYTEKLTIEQMKAFKRETSGLTNREILDFIDGMDVQKPRPLFEKTRNPIINKAIFLMQRNFTEFLTDYRANLLSTEKPARGLPFDYTQTDVDVLFAGFIKVGFIPQTTRWEDFAACFNGKHVPKGFKPIVWTESISKLAYFLNSENESTGAKTGTLWATASRLFTDTSGQFFTKEQLKKAKATGLANYSDVDGILFEIR